MAILAVRAQAPAPAIRKTRPRRPRHTRTRCPRQAEPPLSTGCYARRATAFGNALAAESGTSASALDGLGRTPRGPLPTPWCTRQSRGNRDPPRGALFPPTSAISIEGGAARQTPLSGARPGFAPAARAGVTRVQHSRDIASHPGSVIRRTSATPPCTARLTDTVLATVGGPAKSTVFLCRFVRRGKKDRRGHKSLHSGLAAPLPARSLPGPGFSRNTATTVGETWSLRVTLYPCL